VLDVLFVYSVRSQKNKLFSLQCLDLLLVGDYQEMRIVNVDIEKHLGTRMDLTSKELLPIAIDYDPTKDTIYWCDVKPKSIRSVRGDGSGKHTIVIN
jgi:hypothetical protein